MYFHSFHRWWKQGREGGEGGVVPGRKPKQACSQDFLKGGYVDVCMRVYISKQARQTRRVWGDAPPGNF